MKNHSIAIYGSSTRDNFDKYSDKDILIVADSYDELKNIRIEYENQGFSVSSYTYSKLSFMSKNGSLFIDHLRNESKILIDNEDRLTSILKNHKSQKPNSKQFLDNKKYFELLKFIPNTNKGFGWFCDCLYIGVRNFMILKSAEKGNFNFSYLILLEELKDNNLITSEEIKILQELRVIKRNYREKIDSELPTKNYICKVIKVVNKLDLIENIKILEKNEFTDFVEISIKDENYNHYQKLRLIEMYYYLSGKENKKIEHIICNPQFYASSFKKEKYIVNIIKKITENKKNNSSTSVISNCYL